jgi:hypothetical protein
MLREGALGAPIALGAIGSVGTFPVLRVIGAGGMGIVVLARDPGSDTQVAIKLLRAELRASASAVRRFLTEARHMSQLSHPNVLKILRIGDDEAMPHYVMPYLPRGSLAQQLVNADALTDADRVRIVREVAEAVAFAHSRGLIHRDLKPANVLLGNDGTAYVCDFGLVRTVFNDTLVDPSREEQREGSAPYMSPAVARGEAEDTRCDIYSFGATLYEMLTGRAPFEGRTTQQIVEKILAGPPEPIRKIAPGADARLARIAETCMARELRDRYASMEDVAEDLRRVERGEPPKLGGRRASLLPWAMIAATVTILLSAIVFLRTPRRAAAPTAAAAVPTFELFEGFPRDGHAAAPWQFGSKTSLGGGWQALDRFERTVRDHPILRAKATSRPAIVCNPFTTADFVEGVRIDARSVVMFQESAGPMPAVRFTAPESGRYEISARVDPLAEELTFGQILFAVLNDRRLAMAIGTPSSPLGSAAGRLVTLEAGDHLDFVLSQPLVTRLPGARLSLVLRKIDALAATQPSMSLPRPMTIVPTTQPTKLTSVTLPTAPVAVAFDPPGKVAAIALAGGRIELRAIPQLSLEDSFQATEPMPDEFRFDATGRKLLIRSKERVSIYDLQTKQSVTRDVSSLLGIDARLELSIRMTGGEVALEDAGGRRIWGRPLEPEAGDVSLATWLDDESIVLSTTTGRLMRLNPADGRVVWSVPSWSLRPPSRTVGGGQFFLGCLDPGAVVTFETSTGHWRSGFAGNMSAIKDLAIDPQGGIVRTIDAGGSLRAWSLNDSHPMYVADGVVPPGAAACLSRDGSLLLVAHPSGELALMRAP